MWMKVQGQWIFHVEEDGMTRKYRYNLPLAEERMRGIRMIHPPLARYGVTITEHTTFDGLVHMCPPLLFTSCPWAARLYLRAKVANSPNPGGYKVTVEDLWNGVMDDPISYTERSPDIVMFLYALETLGFVLSDAVDFNDIDPLRLRTSYDQDRQAQLDAQEAYWPEDEEPRHFDTIDEYQEWVAEQFFELVPTLPDLLECQPLEEYDG